jgi:hypothetical protein
MDGTAWLVGPTVVDGRNDICVNRLPSALKQLFCVTVIHTCRERVGQSLHRKTDIIGRGGVKLEYAGPGSGSSF